MLLGVLNIISAEGTSCNSAVCNEGYTRFNSVEVLKACLQQAGTICFFTAGAVSTRVFVKSPRSTKTYLSLLCCGKKIKVKEV